MAAASIDEVLFNEDGKNGRFGIGLDWLGDFAKLLEEGTHF
jgi:hypothetical protein